MDAKVAIVLHAGVESHEGLARALHSLLYAKELKEQGAEVRLIFDGAGSEWVAKFNHGEDRGSRRLAGLFDQLKELGVVYAICDFCSMAFGVKEDLKTDGEPLVAEYMDHPSIASLVTEGFQIWIL